MVSKTDYENAKGFDEENFAVALNDVDFCLKLGQMGLRHVQINSCSAIHHESVSRGRDTSSINASRYEKEQRAFAEKWQDLIGSGDPYYNVNLSPDREDYSLKT